MFNIYLQTLLVKRKQLVPSATSRYNYCMKKKYEDLGFAKVDTDRRKRRGYPEAIYCPGKTSLQIAEIFLELAEAGGNVLATRATPENFYAVNARVPDAQYFETARLIALIKESNPRHDRSGVVAVVTAGTADIPVAEEAAVAAEILGNEVDRIYDVGVAGIHRLLSQVHRIQKASVVIVVAGMEGALPSVVGGFLDVPVVAVPTSIGYGSNFEGLAALLSMMNTCTEGVGVVNIDNGYGAAYLASMINTKR